jgi:hypothetical protein
MTPEEFFQAHPRVYWLALAGPALTAIYASARLSSASEAQQAWGYGALAAVTAAQAIGVVRLRPTRPHPPRTPRPSG